MGPMDDGVTAAPTPLGNDNIRDNLRFLCSYYRSISEVCRRVGINRQQFNKYLSGAARPSQHNLKKICDFFGLEEYEILFPHAKLREIVEIKGINLGGLPDATRYVAHIDELMAMADGDIEKYYGYYYKYYYSFSYPGKILKCLLQIYDLDGNTFYKCIERLVTRPEPEDEGFVYKYIGAALFLRERIFMIDRESLIGNEISETILYPTYKNKVSDLPGLMIGTSGKTSREPICSRVLLRYLGSAVNVRRVMASCGLYDPDSPDIDDAVRRAIHNEIRDGERTMRALPQ